jgi:hypothetical protein
MEAVEIAAIAVGITTVLTSFLIGLRFLVKGWLNELRPNGGSSMKDDLTALRIETTHLSNRIDELFIVISRK